MIYIKEWKKGQPIIVEVNKQELDYNPHNNVFVTMGASNHANEERQVHDYYATDPEAVKKLLEVESFDKKILEPCCGEGHISKVLTSAGYDVTSSDLYDRGFGQGGVSFFDISSFRGDIVTNPPYKRAKEFVEHALKVVDDGRKIAMILKIQFLESQSRKELFENHPPKYVYVFTKRTLCAKNGDFEKYNSSAVCYCWFIWIKGFKGEPAIRWI